MHYIIGIDEAGRGAWAGPVSVGGWMADIHHADTLLQDYNGLTDSKKLSPQKRENLYRVISASEDEGKCITAYCESPAELIDRVGIREANRRAMEIVIRNLLVNINSDDRCTIYIDGCDNYRFDLGEEDVGYDFRKQKIDETVIPTGMEHIQIIYRIAGDLTVPPISAASIIAKVKRDRRMCDFSEDVPSYGFHEHKGYGTKKHHQAILYYGIHPLHRKSYAPLKALISAKA